MEGQGAEVVPVLAALLVALVQEGQHELRKVAQMRRLRGKKSQSEPVNGCMIPSTRCWKSLTVARRLQGKTQCNL